MLQSPQSINMLCLRTSSSSARGNIAVIVPTALVGLVFSLSYVANWLGLSPYQRASPFPVKQWSSKLTEKPQLLHNCLKRDNGSSYTSEYFLDLSGCSPRAQNLTSPGAAKIILAWTSLYEHDIWFGLENEASYSKVLSGRNCTFTRDKSLVSTADMVVFHGCFRRRGGFQLPKIRSPHQLYVYMNTEALTSQYCRNAFIPANGMFNVTATYKTDSDLLFSYSPDLRKKTEDDDQAVNRATNKTALAFWYTSACSSDWSSKRHRYVQELRKYVKVDVYGSCRRYFNDSQLGCPKAGGLTMDECFLSQSKRYKFYLAFENSLCKDYITEKLFKVLQPRSDVVPIVMGPPVADYEKVAPPGSFIHVKNFTSPEELAKYLRYLDNNDEAYNAYHAWRSKFYYNPLPGRFSIDQHPPSQLQALCSLAHNASSSKVWDRLVAWYSIEDNCHVVNDVCVDFGICP